MGSDHKDKCDKHDFAKGSTIEQVKPGVFKSKDEPFGRQLRPVRVEIHSDEQIDREHWARLIKGYLNHQPCSVNHFPTTKEIVAFTIYPDANND